MLWIDQFPRFPDAMKHLTLTLLLIASLPAMAQRSSDQPAADWYTVELLVFEQASERNPPPPANPEVPDTADAVVLQERFEETAAEDLMAGPLLPLPQALRFLPAADGTGTLDEARARLERSPRYRPIVRLAWRQRVAAFSDPVPVRVQGGDVLDRREPESVEPTLLRETGRNADRELAIHEVDGKVALVRGRYLHLHVDLVFREQAPSILARGTASTYGDTDPYSAFPTWHIAERREIQPGELQYFDHRRFGVIAVATPWLAPEPDSEGAPGPAANLTDED